MIYLYIVLGAVLLSFLLLLTTPLRLEITMKNTKSDIELTALWGLLKLSPDIFKRKPSQNKDKPSAQEKAEQSQDAILKRLNDGMYLLKRIYKTFSSSRHFCQKRLVAEFVSADISFSFYDAAITGIGTGLVWSLLYQLLGTLSVVAIIDEHKFNVEPVYEEKLFFNQEINCILKFRIVNIIGILLVVLYHFKKSGKERKREK